MELQELRFGRGGSASEFRAGDQTQKIFRFFLHSHLSCGHILLPTEEESLKN